MKKLACLVVLGFLIFAKSASAVYLVDTGQPSIPTGSSGWSYHGNLVSESWLAAEIVLPQDSIISGIETFMVNLHPGVATIALYSGGGTFPDLSAELFAVDFSTATLPMNNYGWFGLSGLGWELQAGTYWVAFEARKRDGFYSAIAWGAPVPLERYAAYNPSIPGYVASNSLDIGLRVTGVSAVPEAEISMMYLAGLTAIGALVRRRRKPIP